MTDERRFYEAEASGARRSAPAAMRNREPIADVLADWLPSSGLVLEIASGTGEHIVYLAGRFPMLDWQPSDVHDDALSSIAAWADNAGLPNLRSPVVLDAASDWAAGWTDGTKSVTAPSKRSNERASADYSGTHDAVRCTKIHADSCDRSKTAENGGFDVVLNLNMIHISPWSAALGLINGAAKVLRPGGALILYGPWLQAGVETASSNLAFDQQLRQRDPAWGLRYVEAFDAAASERGFTLEKTRAMPANNLMLLFRLPR